MGDVLKFPPNNMSQFRERPTEHHTYMGGTTIGCGDHPTAPKQHKWGAWEIEPMANNRGTRSSRCLNCGLTSLCWYPGDKQPHRPKSGQDMEPTP